MSDSILIKGAIVVTLDSGNSLFEGDVLVERGKHGGLSSIQK